MMSSGRLWSPLSYVIVGGMITGLESPHNPGRLKTLDTFPIGIVSPERARGSVALYTHTPPVRPPSLAV